MKKSVLYLSEQLKALSAAVKERDEYTASHCERTAALAVEVGEACKLDHLELDLLRIAASAHDIGKVGIPDRVLLKLDGFNAEEWAIMQSHAERSYRILSSIHAEHIDTIATAVRHHHEAFDGGGYPDGLAGEDIPYFSRIIALADSYDAMATTRPYHRPKSHQNIMRVLHEENAGKYDPYLRQKFSALIENSSFKAASELN
ncbi:MAG: HD domain-containing protein [Burkholderiales bacterium]|nr:HD domain-containing protein [Burkholderiales bacterium]